MDAEARLTLQYLKDYPLEAIKQMEAWPASEVALVMEPLPPQDVAAVLELATSDLAADVLLLLPRDHAADVLTALTTASAISVMRQFDQAIQGEFFAKLERTVGPGLRLSLTYPEGTAASLADPRVTTLPPDISVKAALERVKQAAQRAMYYHYVVERDGVLAGLITTKELLVADQDEIIATVMRDQVEVIAADTLEEELLQDPKWRLYHTLPVVDRERHFLGAVRYRTLKRIEERLSVSQTAGSLSGALLQMWEAYALIGLQIMTDLAHVAETGAEVLVHPHTQDRGVSDERPSQTA